MTEPLSPTGRQLLEKFKREHGIETSQTPQGFLAWAFTSETNHVSVERHTELEAVRALCKTVGVRCDV